MAIMNDKTILLRRPRPPKREVLPNITSQRSLELKLSNNPHNIPHDSFQLHSIQNHDGMQSPVPTMHSEYESEPIKCLNNKQGNISDITGKDTGSEWKRKGVVLPYRSRGPDPFPLRRPRQPQEVKQEYILPDDTFYQSEPEFCLEDFLLTGKSLPLSRPTLKKAILSRANYEKLTNFLQQIAPIPQDLQATKINLSDQAEFIQKRKRIPRRQAMLEMKYVIQERLGELGLTSSSNMDVSNKLNDVWEEIEEFGASEGIGIKSRMCLITQATEEALRAINQSRDKLEIDDEETLITPAELAILNCLMEGGFVLSLKAHFIHELPDLAPLSHTLIYLNLSFNEFVEFPREVVECKELQVLKLRDNPLRNLPPDIDRLYKLRTLILSFCCITSIPLSLFKIQTLEFLDVSYNKLMILPNEIANLERLRFLNLEGNELCGLPCGLLRIDLFRIRIRNNFMSPLFWRENSTNDPQRLIDLCLFAIKKKLNSEKSEDLKSLPTSVVKMLSSYNWCDCCRGPMYGNGLCIIRPCTEIWGIRRVPFLFRSCSSNCYKEFASDIDPRISEMIYGMDDEQLKTIM